MRVGRSPRSLRPQPPLVAKPAVTASSGAGEVTPDAESAVVDFAPPAGTKWPPESRIHRACEEATRALPECSPGTTGESWAALAARAHQLIGKRVSIQDRLLVGPPTDQVDERDCRPFDHAYPHGEHRPGCDSDRRALVLARAIHRSSYSAAIAAAMSRASVATRERTARRSSRPASLGWATTRIGVSSRDHLHRTGATQTLSAELTSVGEWARWIKLRDFSESCGQTKSRLMGAKRWGKSPAEGSFSLGRVRHAKRLAIVHRTRVLRVVRQRRGPAV